MLQEKRCVRKVILLRILVNQEWETKIQNSMKFGRVVVWVWGTEITKIKAVAVYQEKVLD